MQRYKNNKWWSMRPSDDGNYVAYHEHRELVEILQAKIVDGESEVAQANSYAKVWQNMYEYERNQRVETTKENNKLRSKLIDMYILLLVFVVTIVSSGIYWVVR